MRAILTVLASLIMTASACGGKGETLNTFEFDIAVNAPAAATALVDGTAMLAAVGGVYSRGYPTVTDAAAMVHGTVATLASDGSVRASVTYELGSYCQAITPQLRQTDRFAEGTDANGTLQLTLASVDCVRTDGTGVVVTP